MKGSTLRARLELAIERALEALDKLDGDADLEAQCEDEGRPVRMRVGPAKMRAARMTGSRTILKPALGRTMCWRRVRRTCGAFAPSFVRP